MFPYKRECRYGLQQACRHSLCETVRLFLKDVERMARNAHKIFALAGGEMVVQIQLKGILVHGVASRMNRAQPSDAA